MCLPCCWIPVLIWRHRAIQKELDEKYGPVPRTPDFSYRTKPLAVRLVGGTQADPVYWARLALMELIEVGTASINLGVLESATVAQRIAFGLNVTGIALDVLVGLPTLAFGVVPAVRKGLAPGSVTRMTYLVSEVLSDNLFFVAALLQLKEGQTGGAALFQAWWGLLTFVMLYLNLGLSANRSVTNLASVSRFNLAVLVLGILLTCTAGFFDIEVARRGDPWIIGYPMVVLSLSYLSMYLSGLAVEYFVCYDRFYVRGEDKTSELVAPPESAEMGP